MSRPIGKATAATGGTGKGAWNLGADDKKYLNEQYEAIGGPFKVSMDDAKALFNYNGTAGLPGAIVQRMNKCLAKDKVPFKAGACDDGASIRFFSYTWSAEQVTKAGTPKTAPAAPKTAAPTKPADHKK